MQRRTREPWTDLTGAYDPGTGTWRNIDTPFDANTFAGTVDAEGTLYYAGGVRHPEGYNTMALFALDPGAEAWREALSMPGSGCDLLPLAIGWYDNKVYMFGQSGRSCAWETDTGRAYGVDSVPAGGGGGARTSFEFTWLGEVALGVVRQFIPRKSGPVGPVTLPTRVFLFHPPGDTAEPGLPVRLSPTTQSWYPRPMRLLNATFTLALCLLLAGCGASSSTTEGPRTGGDSKGDGDGPSGSMMEATPDPLELEYEELLAEIEGAIPFTKVNKLNMFIGKLPSKHPVRVRATKALADAHAEAEAERAARKEARETRNAALKTTTEGRKVDTVFAAALYTWASLFGSYDGDDGVALKLADDVEITAGPRTVDAGDLYAGLADMVFAVAPELSDRSLGYPWSSSNAMGKFLKGTLKAPLYASDGKLNKKAVKSLLAKASIKPDAEILGAKAGDIYNLYASGPRHHAAVYAAIIGKVGKPKALKEYKAALAEAPKAMPAFYRRFTKDHGIVGDDAPEDLKARGDVHQIVGFWLRRMADGTDTMLSVHLNKVLKEYDPDFALPK